MFFVYAVLLILALARPGLAATINAASCSIVDIQDAITAAAVGDTVHLPSCTQTTWTSTVTVTKRIILEGNGVANTIIQRSQVASNFPTTNPMFHINGVTGFEMREMTLDGTQDTNPNQAGWRDVAILLSTCVDFRIHHMAFTDFGNAINLQGDPIVQRGLIDHNTFTDIYWRDVSTGAALGYGVHVAGGSTYPALALATGQNIFIEDNTFTRNRHTVASNSGSRYVFRYNTIVDNREDAAAIDAHGFSGSWANGSRQYEIYHNTITNAVTRFAGINPRGGDGVIFNNVMSPMSSDRDILLAQESAGGFGCSSGQPYPLEDQIRELYIWGNTRHGGAAAQIKHDGNCAVYIQLGRDYFTTPRPNYTPYTYPHPLQGSVATPDYTSNLRMHLKFDEGTGSTAEDSTVNNHDGTLQGDAGWGAAQMGASALALDGTVDDFVTVSGGLTNPTTATLAAWVFPTGWPSLHNEVINIRNAVGLRLTNAGSVRGFFYTGTSYVGITVAAGLALNTWHHIAYTVTPGSQVVYVNGLAVGSGTSGSTITYTGLPADTLIGSHHTDPTNFHFQGNIDDVRVYTRALSATDIAGLAALEDPPSLAIQITAPTTQPTYGVSSASFLNMGGVASDDTGVTGVTWNCPTCTPTSGTASCSPVCGASTTFTSWLISSMTLMTGTNLITVTASDASGIRTDTLTVTYTVPPPLGACTHYASPSGTGNGLTQSTPFQVASFWLQASAGKTLCLLDGVYTGGNGMIQPPAGLAGTASLPITVQALNDGGALLDGQNIRNPVVLQSTNQWFVIQGLNARNGLTGVYQFLGSNNTGKRLIGWNATTGQANAFVFQAQGLNTVIEDCAGWGDNVRVVLQGSGTQAGTGGGYRRCWCEWNDHPGGTSVAGRCYAPGVGQTFENILGTWKADP